MKKFAAERMNPSAAHAKLPAHGQRLVDEPNFASALPRLPLELPDYPDRPSGLFSTTSVASAALDHRLLIARIVPWVTPAATAIWRVESRGA